MTEDTSYMKLGLRVMEALLESTTRIEKSDHWATDEITVTIIAGQIHRWCSWPVGRWELYFFKPGDLLRIWVPPKCPEGDQQT